MKIPFLQLNETEKLNEEGRYENPTYFNNGSGARAFDGSAESVVEFYDDFMDTLLTLNIPILKKNVNDPKKMKGFIELLEDAIKKSKKQAQSKLKPYKGK